MDFTTLRPADDSAAAIEAALTRARTAWDDTAARLATAETDRNALLLNGTAQNLAKAETALGEARRDLERVAVIVLQLEVRLAEAQQAEAAAGQDNSGQEQRTLLLAANTAGEAYNAKWTELRSVLRDAAAQVLTHRRTFDQAATDYEAAHTGQLPPGTAAPRPDVALNREAADVREALERLARLPA